MTETRTDFGETLNRIINDTIKSILGEGAPEIYYYMKEFGIKSDQLGQKPDALERVMVEIFKIGWNVFKKAILRSLCQELNVSIDKFADHNFVQCIEIAKREFLLKNTSSTIQNQRINKVQNNKLKVNDDSMLKLCLPELGIAHKTCKSCDKSIDPRNREGLLAELCDECWEFQNDVWKVSSEVAYIPKRTQSSNGDRWI
ncbi:MAG: hypothetical protein ACRD32_02145 [Nitrososphaerales archaeon]